MSTSQPLNHPPTIQDEPWSTFPKLAYSIINDHFVHDHRAVLKVNHKNSKGGIQIKQIVTNTEKGYSIQDETKFWLALPDNRSFLAQIKIGEHLKVHYDNGSRDFLGKPFNLYATMNFTRQLNHLSWRFGAAHFGKVCHTDNRIRIDSGQHKNVTWSNRTLISKGKFSYGIVGAYSFSKNIIEKNTLLLGINIDDRTSCYLRAENDKFRNTQIHLNQLKNFFDHIFLNVINKYDSKTNLGFEFAFRIRGQPFKEAVFVLQREISQDWNSKIKVTTNFDVNLLLRTTAYLAKQNSRLSFGLHGSNLHREYRKFNYGAEIQFNV